MITAPDEASAPRAPREFDLSSIGRERSDVSGFIRIALACLLAICIGGLVWYWLTLPLSVLVSPGQVLIQGLLAVFAALAASGVVWLGPGARSCQVDDTGFTLVFPGGKRKRYDWSDPRTRLHFGEVSSEGSVSYDLTTRSPVSTRLSQELYLTLLDHARRHSMSIRVITSHQLNEDVVTTLVTKPSAQRDARELGS